MSGLLKRIFRGKKSLKNILEAHCLTTDKTKFSVSLFRDELRADNISLKKTRAELMETVLPIINDNLDENYNDIILRNDDIKIKRTDYTTIKNQELTIADFRKPPVIFDLKKTKKELNGLMLVGTTGSGKTELAKKIVSEFKEMPLMIFTTKPEDFGINARIYDDDGISHLKEYFSNWLTDIETRKTDETMIVLDEAFILFSQKTKEIKELSEMVNKYLAFNRAYKSRIIFIAQTPNKEAFGELNTSLISTKLINVSDISNYKSTLGGIPKELVPQVLKTGQFLLFHRGEVPKILSYRRRQT